MAVLVLEQNRPVIFYIHPREIDPEHPRLQSSFKRRLKSYINLKTTQTKMLQILEEFDFVTFEGFLSNDTELLKKQL